jgi:hypothetical protein
MIGSDDFPLPAHRQYGNEDNGDENSTEIDTNDICEFECQQKTVSESPLQNSLLSGE